MANFFDRVVGLFREERASAPVPPTRMSTTVVTPEKAMTLTPVYRATQILATPISKMAIQTMRFAGGMEQVIDNPLLVNKPSLTDTRRNFLFSTVADLAVHGNAYWLKSFNNNGTTVNNLEALAAKSMIVQQLDSGAIVYDYSNAQGVTKRYSSNQIEHIKLFPRAGILLGASPIDVCKDDIKAALDLRDYASNWFAQGGVPTGVLKTNMNITPDDAETVRNRWLAAQRDRTLAVVGQGWDYAHTQLSPSEALFTDVQNQMVQSIARLYGIPARLLLTAVDGSSDTYTNLQDEDMVFIRYTLLGYLDVLEDAFSNCLPRGTRIKFDYESLFRADTQTRYNYYKTGIDAQFLTPEYVQNKEGINA